MEIVRDRRDKAMVLSPNGDVNYNTHSILKDAIGRAVDEKDSPIVIDMGSVEHIDSMGLGMLTKMWKKGNDVNIPIRLAACSHNVDKLIRLVNLDKRIQMFPTVDEALKD